MSSPTATPFTVFGKTAIVTGAGSGINLEFARLLLNKGCNVVFADITLRNEAEDLISQHKTKDQSPQAAFFKTDVTSWPALISLFDFTVNLFGGFDILCPGAGVYEPRWSTFWVPPGTPESKDATDAGHYKQLDINLIHPIRTTQIALSHWLFPRMPNTSSASPENPKRIVHLSSAAGHTPGALRAPMYAAAKYAVTGFVRSLALLEPHKGIRVTAVSPGLVYTPLWTQNPDKMKLLDEKDGWITVQEVADAMMSCVQGDKYTGGTILEVGAGYTRQVKPLNDPGPDNSPGRGMHQSYGDDGDADILATLEDIKVWGSY